MARTRLEQLAAQRGISTADFAREFNRRAASLGVDTSITRAGVHRWLQGLVPRPGARRVLEAWLGEPIDTLLGPPRTHTPTAATEQDYAVNAAQESARHALEAAAALDPSALEHLHAAAAKAARAYYVSPPLEMLTDLVTLRDTIYTQLDRTHKPLQKAELYLLAGQVCGLLSSVTWDLGLVEAAEEQARAAYTYGCVIDHHSLQAWARALQVTLAFWSGHARAAARTAAAALETAPAGTARARLHSVHARSLALLGARGEVRDELAAATDELDRAGQDAFLDEVGGELAFDRARHALCAGAAFVALGDGEPAEQAATEAVGLFEATPPEQRWSLGALSAHVDLGAARTLRDDLAGAQAALRAVFEIPTARRTEAIALRLHALSRILGTTRYRGAPEAIALIGQIEEFTAISLSRAAGMRSLPS
ncbi:hypothetical protein [Nocardia farcinica]|uniref:hypothetical protein n=1 Tax=Nocardia farcinica TaxID=37329 RepID=UPI002454B3E9|nr:hypothetical protein [Nocardia farcinica]